MSRSPDIRLWTPELALRLPPPPPAAYAAPVARFATAWSGRLRQLTRQPVTVELEGSVVVRFAAYQAEDPRERCFNVLRADGPRCPGVLTFDAGLLGLLVQLFLGGGRGADGDGGLNGPRYAEGAVGWRIARRLAGVAVNELDGAFLPLQLALAARCTRQEARLQWSGLMPDDERVLLSRFSVRVEGRAGRMELLWPLRAMQVFLRSAGERSDPVASAATAALSAALTRAPVELTAILGETELSLGELAALQVGDVLTLMGDESAELALLVEGRRKWSGRPGVVRGHRALRLTGS